MFSYYLHTLDPFAIKISEDFGVRWYGLSYALAFILGYYLLRFFISRNYSEIKREDAENFISWIAIFGVLLGGRLGYMLFYDLDRFLANPISFFYVFKGGMASHGGIIGIIIFSYIYAKRKDISWLGLGDNLVVLAPVGIFLGRIANFINGELYGRVTQVSWAVYFPAEIIAEKNMHPKWEAIRAKIYTMYPDVQSPDEVADLISKKLDVKQAVLPFLSPRHPSQIYEALLEGALIFIVLFLIRIKVKNLPVGLLTGIFFIIYAGVRFYVEYFREPDSTLLFSLTKGQFLSIFMVPIGVMFLVYSLYKKTSLRNMRM